MSNKNKCLTWCVFSLIMFVVMVYCLIIIPTWIAITFLVADFLFGVFASKGIILFKQIIEGK